MCTKMAVMGRDYILYIDYLLSIIYRAGILKMGGSLFENQNFFKH